MQKGILQKTGGNLNLSRKTGTGLGGQRGRSTGIGLDKHCANSYIPQHIYNVYNVLYVQDVGICTVLD